MPIVGLAAMAKNQSRDTPVKDPSWSGGLARQEASDPSFSEVGLSEAFSDSTRQPPTMWC
jgi:hypothetical protein